MSVNFGLSFVYIWWCRPWFDSAYSSLEWSGLAWSNSALYTLISDNLTYLSSKFKGKTLSCIWVNMVLIHYHNKLF